ncbi:putative PGG domain-containing protein [Helianthus annuus]|nr:putative PGG domain-containing protein [Helianthus annuus]
MESPNIARNNKEILKAITISFPMDLGFKESFIYPCIYPTAFHYVRQKTVVRGSLLFHPDKCLDNILRVVRICNNTWCNLLGKNSMILLVLIATLYPIYQLICLLILMLHLSFSMLYLLLWKVLAITVPPIKYIEKKRKEYKKAKYILSLICKMMGPSNEGYSDSFFVAVRQDIYKVVDEILFNSPATINCKDEDGYNIIQLSIMNRAEKVCNLIYHIIEHTKSQREMTDSSLNNLAHLAGRLAPSFVLSRTTGAALQLQRELLWFEEVERLVLPLQLTEKNIYKETPLMVFTREHQDLLKEGEIWMKTTAESCSITAALIVTVVFAAAITVPGGSDEESGIPLFRKEFSFTIFAVSNALSLFTGITALLLFLSTILTASSSEKDFLVVLPRRLIFGLLMLFLSAISMMVAFGAILFLVFCDKRPWMLAPICTFAFLPISVIVTIKLPLLANLIQSTFFPMIGKKSYLDSCKVSRKKTIFMK